MLVSRSLPSYFSVRGPFEGEDFQDQAETRPRTKSSPVTILDNRLISGSQDDYPQQLQDILMKMEKVALGLYNLYLFDSTKEVERPEKLLSLLKKGCMLVKKAESSTTFRRYRAFCDRRYTNLYERVSLALQCIVVNGEKEIREVYKVSSSQENSFIVFFKNIHHRHVQIRNYRTLKREYTYFTKAVEFQLKGTSLLAELQATEPWEHLSSYLQTRTSVKCQELVYSYGQMTYL